MKWDELNERQQQYLQAIYEVDQEQEQYERGAWNRGGRPLPASEFRWQEYGVFSGVGSALYDKLYLRKLIDEGTGSTFNALEKRGLILCKYTNQRRGSHRLTFEPFLMVQITKAGRKLVREATGQKRQQFPVGTLREWHWKALALAWEAGETGVDYLVTSWNTWLRLRDYKRAGVGTPLIKEVMQPLAARMTEYGYLSVGTPQYVIVLTEEGRQFYRENWAKYHEMYPQVEAPEPEEE